MWRFLRRLLRDDRAAIAPLTALSLIALIAVGGVAFDYARLAAMDTELQQAADDAALAAATQLDRSDGAQARATAAIQNAGTNRLAANVTRFANDSSANGRSVEIASITFCSEFDDTVADTGAACTSTTDDTTSTYVVVTTELRTANYAFTPIVAAFSGTISASAVAGVQSSICNVSPLMVCAPTRDWPTDADIGEGVRLKPGANIGAWAPGDFGLLDFGSGNTGVINALQGFGLNGCQETDTTATEPGVKDVTDAINTRMDVYDKGDASVCNASTGYGCPAPSARKDAIIKTTAADIVKINDATPPTAAQIATNAAAACPANPQGQKPALVFDTPTDTVRGLERDSCHYTNTCAGGNIGDKAWNRDAYFLSNYGWDSATWPTNTGLSSSATRYEVYQWELKNPSVRLASKSFGSIAAGSPKITGPAANKKYTWSINAQCSYPSVKYGSTAYPAQKDRRILTVIAADCTNLKGKGTAFEDFEILRAFDIFLTEPSLTRTTYPGPTNSKEIYGEVIGPAETASGGGFQYYSRIKPYLVR